MIIRFVGDRSIINGSLKTPLFLKGGGRTKDLKLGLLFDVFLEYAIPVGMA